MARLTAFTLAEVQRCGQEAPRILVSLAGHVYDVSVNGGRDFFGPAGPYKLYAGHDATMALAKMSMRAEDLDRFEYDLDDGHRQTLADWVAYFDVKYGRVGTLRGASHPPAAKGLPKGKDPTKLISMGHPAVSGSAAAKEAFDVAAARAGGRADEPRQNERLSRELIVKTNDLHTLALRGAFMQSLMQRRVDAREYAKWVSMLFHVYTELEHQLGAAPAGGLVAAIDDERLHRLPNLREDLVKFFGTNFLDLLPSPTLTTIRYVSRISDIAHEPHRLVVHHWMRYGGGLAGGQFLRVAIKAGLRLEADAKGLVAGVRYHQFDRLGDVQSAYDAYLARIDALPVTLAMRAEMVDEARVAFDLNIRLNDEFSAAGAAQRAAL